MDGARHQVFMVDQTHSQHQEQRCPSFQKVEVVEKTLPQAGGRHSLVTQWGTSVQ
jgi:hypothetical protein